MNIAIYPGTFDPITLGHLNIIKRASRAFDKLIVCVMVNKSKTPVFSSQERLEQVRKVTERFENVEVDFSEKMLAEYARDRNATIVVRGLRALSDFEKECQMALINRKINPNLDTLFLAASEKYTYLSSSAVREMVQFGVHIDDLREFMPREIIDEVVERILHRR